ncbi:MAG: hypothetical protein ACOC7K_00340 [bacterium]
MNDSLTTNDSTSAAEYVQARRDIRFYIGMACLVVATLLPPFLLFPLAASGSFGWKMIAAIIALTIWGLAWFVYAKAHPVTGFLVAGACFLIAGGCIWYAATTFGAAGRGINGTAFAAAVVFTLVGLRVTRLSWLVLTVSRHPNTSQMLPKSSDHEGLQAQATVLLD